jgi:hypothetical protein
MSLRIASTHPDQRPGEVDVAPAQRDQLTATKTCERGGHEDRGVLHARRGSNESMHLLGGEHVDPVAAGQRRLLDLSDRVRRKRPDLLRAAEDPVQQHQRLPTRARRPASVPDPPLDRRRRDRLDRQLSEGRQQLRADDRLVSGDRRRLPAAVMLDVAQPLRRRISERRSGAHHSRERAAASTRRSQSSAVRFVK